MLLVTVLVTFLHPGLEWFGPFGYSLVAHLALLVACFLVPWEKLPGRAALVIPVLDCLAVGLTRGAADQYLAVLGYLLVFPVTWLSASKQRSGVIIAVLATLLSAALPPIILGAGITRGDFLRIVLLPVILAAIALAVHTVYNVLSHQRRLLEKQQTEVRNLLRASEEREQLLVTIVGTVSVGVCALDARGRPILTNHWLSRHLTGTGSEDPFGAGHTDIPIYHVDRISPLPPDQHPFHRAARGEAFTDELVWVGSATVQRAYSVTCKLMKHSNGQCSGAVLAFTDVTALVEALTAKDRFVASVSHELRTPLTSILGYLELAFDEDLEPGLEHYLFVVRRNAQRLLILVNDLLTIASDALTINPRTADLTEVISHCVEAARPRAKAAGITLEVEAGSPARGIFDPDRIGQAIDNVVSNAIKYTPEGGSIKVRAGASADMLSCEVTDTGIGMSKHELDQAFTRFFRAANAHSSTIPGAGLGLAITKTIIENHKGTVALVSSPGHGTTVEITLPKTGTTSSP
ncbi:HAMP domain-containing sensor histidine kinase [Paenarthrobacter sp. CAP02]|uniref:sensor histidine kinase n=1 Tax=Paenarthrobacter sp. CAP02 TaxID=3158144 RepID=UPI0032DBCE6D